MTDGQAFLTAEAGNIVLQELKRLNEKIDLMDATNQQDHLAICRRLDGVEAELKVVGRRLDGV